ncbi:DsbA family protein [Pseudogulbenkiania sp. MAI-1]|uniref:DsbA family protein n=1 Tax=Pseudogulbenkiania sp. MAI-1 TaxID=990370 RepID=UPI00045E73D6|nr:DsbA family protein [Pseudogulbenkiania sp. MAI-1]
MTTAVLHYLYDPLCGWCYGAAPLIEAARAIPGLRVELHGGGMMAGANRQPASEALRNYVMPHDHRIAALTGQAFGADYFDGLLRDSGAVFDSAPPTTAILAAEALGGRGADLLKRIQIAHYVEGRRIADTEVLGQLAAGIGLDPAAFAAEFARQDGAATQAHITASRHLLSRVGGRGFPTFALQLGETLTVLDAGRFLGQPAAWRAFLEQHGQPAQAEDSESAAQEGCANGSCAI